MKTFLRSLLTRKFLLTLGTALVFGANGQYDLVLYTVLGFLGVEGAADTVSRVNGNKTK